MLHHRTTRLHLLHQDHEEVFRAQDRRTTSRKLLFVQINMFGDVEVTDFDGETLPKRIWVRNGVRCSRRRLMYFPQTVAEGKTAVEAASRPCGLPLSPATTFHMN